MNNKMLYDFSGFRVDTKQKCLWRGEDIVSLTPKAFETLLVLIKNKGNVVSKNSILDEVWKDTFVEESTLAQNISTLRKTLAKYDKDKEFIVTIPRRGYRFIVDVTELNADEEVLVLEKHSVTHIVAEQEQIHDSAETAISTPKDISPVSTANNSTSKKMLIGLPIALVTLLIAGVAGIYFLTSNAKNFYNSKLQNVRINSLFSSGTLTGVTASSDGKYIAFAERNVDGDSISLKQIDSGNRINILPKSDLFIRAISFSPNNNFVYYTAYPKATSSSPRIGNLYKVPILGGATQQVIKDIDSPVAVSVDNKKLAFTRNKLKEKQSVLVIADADGSNEKELIKRDLQNGFSNFGVSWSPDGKHISTVIADNKDENQSAKLLIVNAESGEQNVLKTPNWIWIGRTAWLKDGSGIALVAYGAKSPNITDEIWFVSYPEGETRLISNGAKGINGFSLTDDLSSIIATKVNRITSSYVSPLDDLENSKEIAKTVDEESLLSLGINWTKEEKILYSKTQNGNADIWIMDSDGTNQKQITSDESADYAPRISSDGRYIFFISNRNGGINLWRMNANGENPVEIVKTKGVFPPTVSQTDEYIYYSAKVPNKSYNVLWRTDFDGKNVKQLTNVQTYGGKVSPDGKYIFCFFPDANVDPQDITKPLKMTVLSAEDGKVIKQFAVLTTRRLPIIEWKKDNASFLILEQNNGKSVLSEQTLTNDEPKILKTWKDEKVYQIAISNDGKKLFFEKGKEVNSVIQFKDVSAN